MASAQSGMFMCWGNFAQQSMLRISLSGISFITRSEYILWQYGLWSFQAGGTKLERFLYKNLHRKWLNFELNWYYYSMKKKLRKIRIIFDIESWLLKSNFGTFWQFTVNPKLKLQSFPLDMLILRQESF